MTDLETNSINDLPRDDEVESRARGIFRDACRHVDSQYVLRLGQARRKALDAGPAHSPIRTWAPLGGAVACCVLVVAGVVWMQYGSPTTPPPDQSSPTSIATSHQGNDDATPEVGTNQMEMVRNLDFYRWLAAQPSVASVPASNAHQ